MITVCLISTKLEINSKSLILNLLSFNLVFQRWVTHAALLPRALFPIANFNNNSELPVDASKASLKST